MKKYKHNLVRFKDLTHKQRMYMFGCIRCLVKHQLDLKILKQRVHKMLGVAQAVKREYRNDQTYQKSGLLTELCIANDDWVDALDEVDDLVDKVRQMKHAIWIQELEYRLVNGCISTSDLILLELNRNDSITEDYNDGI